jgi:hypothetical protein
MDESVVHISEVAQRLEVSAHCILIHREDQESHRTGSIQSERQVFELARELLSLNGKGGAA